MAVKCLSKNHKLVRSIFWGSFRNHKAVRDMLREKSPSSSAPLHFVASTLRSISRESLVNLGQCIVSCLVNQYLSLLFKVKQTMSGYYPHCCPPHSTVLCWLGRQIWFRQLSGFFIPKLRYSVKIQLLKSNFTSCRVLNRTSARTGPLLTGSGSCYFFLTGSGSSKFTYKKVPKNSKKMFLPSYLYTGSGSGTDRKVPALAGSGSAPLLTETGFSVTGTVCMFQSHRQRTRTADPVPTTWFFLSQDFVIL